MNFDQDCNLNYSNPDGDTIFYVKSALIFFDYYFPYCFNNKVVSSNAEVYADAAVL